ATMCHARRESRLPAIPPQKSQLSTVLRIGYQFDHVTIRKNFPSRRNAHAFSVCPSTGVSSYVGAQENLLLKQRTRIRFSRVFVPTRQKARSPGLDTPLPRYLS